MRTVLKITVLSISVLAAGVAFGGERPELRVRQALERAAPLRGREWVAARDALTGLGGEERRVLLDRAKALSWARASWKDDAVVAIAAAHVRAPELAEKVLALEGLAPAKYLAKRRPEPEVGRELARLAAEVDAAPLLFELALKTADVYPFAARGAYPAKLGEGDVAGLRAKEALALRTGVVEAIAASKHPAAALLLEEVARDEAADPAVRRAAATGLGDTKAPGADTALLALARDAKAPMVVRTGAIAGLGQVRTRATLDALVELHARGGSPEVQQAAIAAVGSLATASVLKRQKTAAAAELRERASAWLVDTLASRRGAEHEVQLVEALGMTADRAQLKKLVQRLAEGGDPEDVRERLEHARSRLARAVARER